MKVRHVNFAPDEWLAGTIELSAEDRGVYVTVCALIYSRGGPIDESLVFRHCCEHGNRLRASLDRLHLAGKITRKGPEISQKRAENELEMAQKRSTNGSDNVAKRWNNKELYDELVLPLTHTNNQQPTTNNQQESKENQFDRWWEAYPHKVGKAAARAKFDIARHKVSLDDLIAGVQRYIVTKPQDRDWCNPATWLNQERWLDQPAQPVVVQLVQRGVSSEPTVPEPSPEEVWRARLVVFEREGKWTRELWGPRPDEDGCQAPPEFLRKRIAK